VGTGSVVVHSAWLRRRSARGAAAANAVANGGTALARAHGRIIRDAQHVLAPHSIKEAPE